jgi:preprotein translocase subunit SecG
MILYYTLTTFYVLVCLCLLLVILLQQGKGGDMASAFGGGSSQTAFGARGGATVLSKATAVLAVLFMLSALALAIIGQRGPGSLVSGTSAPARPATAPVTPPKNLHPAAPTPAGTTPAAPASTAPAPPAK